MLWARSTRNPVRVIGPGHRLIGALPPMPSTPEARGLVENPPEQPSPGCWVPREARFLGHRTKEIRHGQGAVLEWGLMLHHDCCIYRRWCLEGKALIEACICGGKPDKRSPGRHPRRWSVSTSKHKREPRLCVKRRRDSRLGSHRLHSSTLLQPITCRRLSYPATPLSTRSAPERHGS